MTLVLLLAPVIHQAASLLSRVGEAWTYVLLAGSAIITEELAPVVGGFAAEQGHVGFVRVVLACTIGMWAASMLLYGIGRWNSAWVRLVLNRSSKRVGRLLLSMRAAPWRASIVSRVAFGVRIALPLACGAAHVDVGVFAAATALGALVWSAAFATLGWFFGESAVLVLGSVRRYENLILALFVAVGVFVFFIVRRRWRRMEGA